jgi:hypothetical protein
VYFKVSKGVYMRVPLPGKPDIENCMDAIPVEASSGVGDRE